MCEPAQFGGQCGYGQNLYSEHVEARRVFFSLAVVFICLNWSVLWYAVCRHFVLEYVVDRLSMSIGSWGRWKPRWTTQTSTPIVRLSGGPGGLGFSSSPSCCCASLCCRTWCLAPSCSSQCVRGTASRILHHRIRACRRYHAMVHARFRYAPRDRTTLRGQTPKPMPAFGAGPRST
jgi:hypothetical protein